MRVELVAVSGPAEGRSFPFEHPDIFVFGRGLTAHCPVPSDRAISRNHFMIQLNPPDCMIMDLRSSNGTIVNGVRYGGVGAPPVEGMRQEEPTAVRLADGDEIVAGTTTMRVRIIESEAMEETNVDESKPAPKKGDTVLVSATSLGLAPSDSDTHLDETRPNPLAQAASEDSPDGPEPPPVAGYDFLRCLGSGSMGSAYLARDYETRRLVAVKTMVAKVSVMRDVADRFDLEISNSVAASHPNLIELYKRGRIGNTFYFITEYVEGTNAGVLIDMRGGCMDLGESIPIVLQALSGLDHAHRQGRVHRDVKPSNLLLAEDGDPWTVKVADFGLAKSFENAGLGGLTLEGNVGESLHFVAREQLLEYKGVHPATDVYAMGATLYLMLTGMPVRKGLEEQVNTVDCIRTILNEPLVPLLQRDPSLSPSVAEVVDRALSDDIEARYADAGEMARALEEALRGE